MVILLTEIIVLVDLVEVDQVLLPLMVDQVEVMEMMVEMDNRPEHVVVAVVEVLVVQELLEQMELMEELELNYQQHLEIQFQQ